MKNYRSSILSILFVASSLLTKANFAHVKIEGTISIADIAVEENFNPADLPVEVWNAGKLIETIYPENTGKYEIILPFGKQYRIRYGGGPWIVKMIDVNLDTPFFPAGNIGYTMQNDISLFHRPASSEFDFLENTPVAVADFDYEANCMTWNTGYNQKLTSDIFRSLRNTNQQKQLP